MKPPLFAALRPTFGIGVVIGAALLLSSRVTGNDSLLGLVLGGGLGIALGLGQLARSSALAREAEQEAAEAAE